MTGVEIRELEAFLALAEELHFGRAAARLYLTQSRISQLLRALEQRIGARLVERTSRSVRLTPLGEQFLTGLRPAYTALHTVLDDARHAARELKGGLRLGFQGVTNDYLLTALDTFQRRFPDCVTDLVEVPLSDPFGALYRREVDAAVVLLPVHEPDLIVGPVFSRQPPMLAVSGKHPLVGRASLTAQDLTDCPLIEVGGPAPDYWTRAQSRAGLPSDPGTPPPPTVGTLAEGLALVAADRGTMLLCRPTGTYHQHPAVTYIPVTGLRDSALALVWHRDRTTARIRAFAESLTTATESAADEPSQGQKNPSSLLLS
ncbi:LysR family transcriptional regulator [Nocardia sp. NPDC088792]|uniref:LysR family transcriptional regulator n=1 Tax=Nocardia sp. NPDC088792 TaxID=3364332 RepID=UPI00383088C4